MEKNIFENGEKTNIAAIDLFNVYKKDKSMILLNSYESTWDNLALTLVDSATTNSYGKIEFIGLDPFLQNAYLHFYKDYANHLTSLGKLNEAQEELTLKMMKFSLAHLQNWDLEEIKTFFALTIKHFSNKAGVNYLYSFDIPTGVNDKDTAFYSKNRRTFYINADKFLKEKNDSVKSVVDVTYEIIKHTELQYFTNVLKTEISPRALYYMNEHIFISAFGKAFSKKILNVPLMELDTRKAVHQDLKYLMAKIPQTENFVTEIIKDPSYLKDLCDSHYVKEAKNYGDSFITTMASKAVRGRPNSWPCNMKKYLFLNAQLKTVVQLEDQLEKARNDFYYNPTDENKKEYYDKLAIHDYLVKRNNVLLIQNLFQKLSKQMNVDHLQQLFHAQKHTKDDYDLAIVLLQDRLHQINTYSASNSTNVINYKSELDRTKDLLAFAVSVPNKQLDAKISKYNLKADKFNLLDDKKLRYFQTLTGLGFGTAIGKIQKSLENSSEFILHNLTEEQARHYKKQLSSKQTGTLIEIVPPIEEKRPTK